MRQRQSDQSNTHKNAVDGLVIPVMMTLLVNSPPFAPAESEYLIGYTLPPFQICLCWQLLPPSPIPTFRCGLSMRVLSL
jgi:hypothetical protein